MTETTQPYRLEKKLFIDGEIELLTGLHVGASDSGISIGGPDKMVVRDPVTHRPYIPGSSLKGKMRCLLERMTGQYDPSNGTPANGPSKEGFIAELFGVPAETSGRSMTHLGASKLIVRDAPLTDASAMLLDSYELDTPYGEVKTEVAIDRITSEANPRNFERVPAGARFRLSLVINVMVDDENDAHSKAEDLLSRVFWGLRVLQDDYLGGQGTRGYGKVKFHVEKVTYKDREIYESGGEAQTLDVTIPKDLRAEGVKEEAA